MVESVAGHICLQAGQQDKCEMQTVNLYDRLLNIYVHAASQLRRKKPGKFS